MDTLDVMYQRVAGIDVSKSDAKVCIRVPSLQRNRYHCDVTTWGATVPEIMNLCEHLNRANLDLVVMESTSDYWKPFFYLMEETINVQLINARQARNLPGRKTDVSDATWLAKTGSWGLLRPSFVPPPQIRGLRDLTRARSTITHYRASELQRLEKYLENTGSKLSCVVSDLDGVSSKLILRALTEGERDPHVLAALAKGRLKNKIEQLEQALTGIRFTTHDVFMITLHLDELDAQQARLDALDQEITAVFAPFRLELELLSTIPGVNTTIAEVIIAETGADMSAFPTPANLASWAGVCPGNNESAGRHKPAPTKDGNKYLKESLGQAALNIAKQKTGFLSTRYKKIANRRGKPRAIVATEHTIVTAIWNMLANGECYAEPQQHRYEEARNDHTRQHAINQLTKLGYTVTLTQAA
jgi:transposase